MVQITSTILVAGRSPITGLIYPRFILDYICGQNVPLIGQIGFPENGKIDLKKASHSIEKLWVEDNKLKAKIRILDTSEGLRLMKMLNKGYDFRISGYGIKIDNVIQLPYELAGVHFTPADATLELT